MTMVEQAPTTTSCEPSLKPFPHLLLVLFSALPLLIAVVLLQLLGPLGSPLFSQEAAILRSALTTEPFLPGALTLIAVLAVHVCVCLAGITLGYVLLRTSYGTRSVAWVMIGVGLGIVLLIPLLATSDVAVYRLTYFEFISLYKDTGAAASLLEPRIAGLPAMTIAILVPVGLGTIGIATLTAATLAQVQELGEPPAAPNPEFEAKLQFVYSRLKRCLYLLSVGLVTSTVAASLFFHLPSKLSAKSLVGAPSIVGAQFDTGAQAALESKLKEVEAAEKLAEAQEKELKAIRSKFDTFAAELSIFWGAIFTLTLVAAVGLPMAVLQRKMRVYVEAPPLTNGLAAQGRLEQAGMARHWTDQLKLLLAVLAPLASGPIANLIQVASG